MDPITKEKRILIAVLLVVFIIILIFSAKLVLFANFITGNDIIIRLESDKETIDILKGQKENITFEAKVTTNPFCKAVCSSEFIDISKDLIVEKDNFTLHPTLPLKKEYYIEAKQPGSGQGIYRFDMECSSIGTFLCHTSGETTTRSKLITVNYNLNEEEKILKEEVKNEVISQVKKTNGIYNTYLSYAKAVNKLNETLIINLSIEGINKNFSILNKDLLISNELWKRLEYKELKEKNKETNVKLNKIETEVQNLKNLTELILFPYNKIVDELFINREALANYQKNITYTEYAVKLNTTINIFNENLHFIESKNSLIEKENNLEKIKFQISSLNQSINKSLETNETINISITNPFNIRLKRIYLDGDNTSYISLEFNEPQPQCCVFGKCQLCENNPENYPVIFIHGHAVDKDSSAEYSLEGFNQIQKKLEEEGYLNAGTTTLFTTKNAKQGNWSLIPAPLTIRVSYYFDIFKEPENYVAVQTKSENIDTYAIRLKDIIDIVKYKTGKPKVNIVAFSMGGLVARRYLQIFNDESVNKIILIGTPNNGIVGDVANYCSVTGETLECRDMNENSLFMNKLNLGIKPKIPIYNIIGTGCDMEGKQGDGIVLEEKALLDGAQNYIIKGKCRSLIAPLHLDLRNIGIYPEVYEIIKNALK